MFLCPFSQRWGGKWELLFSDSHFLLLWILWQALDTVFLLSWLNGASTTGHFSKPKKPISSIAWHESPPHSQIRAVLFMCVSCGYGTYLLGYWCVCTRTQRTREREREMFRKTLGVLKLRYNLLIALDQWIILNTYPLQKKKKSCRRKTCRL
jgi:hypothetical protein